jgi:hypothetical protein
LGSGTTLSLYAGENLKGETWTNRGSRTALLQHYGSGGAINITDQVKKDDSSAIAINKLSAGKHLLYLHSNPSFISL